MMRTLMTMSRNRGMRPQRNKNSVYILPDRYHTVLVIRPWTLLYTFSFTFHFSEVLSLMSTLQATWLNSPGKDCSRQNSLHSCRSNLNESPKVIIKVGLGQYRQNRQTRCAAKIRAHGVANRSTRIFWAPFSGVTLIAYRINWKSSFSR